MRHFVELTYGGTVIMGHTTLKSLPGGRPLKHRRNIVLTHRTDSGRTDIEIAHTVDEVCSLVADEDPAQVWVMGGASVYRQLLPFCRRVALTKNDCLMPADSFFPNLDKDPSWQLISRDGEGITPEGIPYEFLTYGRLE
jgi:dihydrofolate reductase